MSNYSENQLNDDTNSPWYKIIRLVPEGSRVLDVGCSSGNLGAALIKDKKCEVVGIDLNEEDIKAAAKRLNGAYVKNIEHDDLSSLGTFDCVIFADVIEHLVDPVATLAKVKASLLKPSGSVIFSIPNMAHMGTRLMLLEGRFVYGETGLLDKTHLHYYDREEVERVFHNAGYTIEIFDWVERYIPEKVLAHQLENIGLNASEEFFKRSKRLESTAYEFVGKSVPADKHATPMSLPFVSPRIEEIDAQIRDIEAIYQQDLGKQTAKLEQEIDKLLHGEARLISSISWRITLPLRLVNGAVWHQRQRLRIFLYQLQRHPLLRPFKYPELAQSMREYRRNDQTLAGIKRGKGVKTAVVVHLYYPEAWPVLRKKIQNLDRNVAFDLFVTVPAGQHGLADDIQKTYPGAHLLEVSNWGRDVLPFIKVASKLEALGYEFVLKLHSKKSPHRADGKEWLSDILTNLLPDDSSLLDSIMAVLGDKKTGVIGPEGQYISLLVNYDANSVFVFKALKRIYSKATARRVYKDRAEYGFFAGTMFWARLDALRGVFAPGFQVFDFEHERGRIDGTLAHALERLFCIGPELEKRDMYEIGPAAVTRLTYRTDNIPEWSDVHPDNEKKARRKLAA